jgi:inner membrane protein
LTPRRAGAILAVALVGAIFALDLLWSLLEGSTGVLAYGLVDEPAHLATCVVALLAIVALTAARPPARFVAAALIASVAIDFDHLPGYLGSHAMTGSLPRPYTHSLLTVAVLLALGIALKQRDRRQVALGVAFGISAHLLRDLATGPGVSLLWPFSDTAVTIPYAVYAGGLLLAVAGVAFTARRASATARLAPRRLGAQPLPSAGPPGGS